MSDEGHAEPLDAAFGGEYGIERKAALKILRPELAAVLGAERAARAC